MYDVVFKLVIFVRFPTVGFLTALGIIFLLQEVLIQPSNEVLYPVLLHLSMLCLVNITERPALF